MENERDTKTNRFGITRELKSPASLLAYMREYRKRPEVIARTREWMRKNPRKKDRSRLPHGVTSSEYWKDVNVRRREYSLRWSRAHVLQRYGLTLDDYAALLEKQSGKCAMPFCRRVGRLGVDHDHITGRVRGLLCPPCNSFLGFFERNPNLVRQVRSYLREKQTRPSPGSTASEASTPTKKLVR